MDPSPFDFVDADVTLRTSNNISLKVHSRILVEASNFFRDLFTLPQPPHDDSLSTSLVDISERGEVVHMLLMFTYPIEEPQVESLSLLGEVLGAALKYDMGLATQSLRRVLASPRFIDNEPLRVYAVACRHNLDAEARLASTQTLTTTILDAPLSEELKYITAYDYHRLLNLHRHRSIEAQKLLVFDQSVRCLQCSLSPTPPRWWNDFVARARIELQRAPTTDVIFSMTFLAQAAQAGCPRCGTSILESHAFLVKLKASIDALPATI